MNAPHERQADFRTAADVTGRNHLLRADAEKNK